MLHTITLGVLQQPIPPTINLFPQATVDDEQSFNPNSPERQLAKVHAAGIYRTCSLKALSRYAKLAIRHRPTAKDDEALIQRGTLRRRAAYIITRSKPGDQKV